MEKTKGSDKTRTTVAALLVEWLRKHGIRHVFGVPSGGWLPYMHAMKTGGVEFVLVSNEASAGFMGCVYAWLKGTPGACYGTMGPGSTNLATGVGAALLNRTPLLSFTSEAPRAMLGRTVQMAIDQQALYKPLTKTTMRLDPTQVRRTLDAAFHAAIAEVPGPVHIGLPEDLADIEVEADNQSFSPESRATAMDAAPETVQRAMEAAFAQAARPVLAVGMAAVRNDCGELIRQLVERHRIPVVLTPMAKGILPENHPAYAGVLFHALSDRVAETHKQADLVVGVGYDPVEFNYETWMPSVDLIHIDSQPADIDSTEYPNVLNVVGAIAPSLERLVAMQAQSFNWDFEALAARRKSLFEAFTPQPGRFGPLAALSALREQLPEDGIMTCDVGAHTHLIGQMWPAPRPGTQLMDNGWSSMGFGVPSAIAAKLCCPEREVVCVTGDGGFLMMAGEMATARRLGLRVVFLLLSDNSLDLIRIKQANREMPEYGTALGPEVGSTGQEIFGVPILKAEDGQSYREALESAFSWDGPIIVQARIDASEYEGLILRKHK